MYAAVTKLTSFLEDKLVFSDILCRLYRCHQETRRRINYSVIKPHILPFADRNLLNKNLTTFRSLRFFSTISKESIPNSSIKEHLSGRKKKTSRKPVSQGER